MEQVTRLGVGPETGIPHELRLPAAERPGIPYGRSGKRPGGGVPGIGSAGRPGVGHDPEIGARAAFTGAPGTQVNLDRLFREGRLGLSAARARGSLDLDMPPRGDAEDDAPSESQNE